MNFNVAHKCTLEEKRIQIKNEEKVEMIEIQLLSTKEDLSQANKFNSKITSIHLPLPPFCDLTNIIKCLYAKNDDYEFINKVIDKCRELKCGLVAHADVPLETLYQNEGFNMLIDYIDKSGIIWHIENVTHFEIKNGNACIKAPLQICDYINKRLKREVCFPLLDICHFLMTQDDFDSSLSFNLRSVLQMYNTKKYYMHLNSRIGCGDPADGGVHGSNFHYDTPLLEKILKSVKQYNPMLILEVYESDYYAAPNAKELHSKILQIQETL